MASGRAGTTLVWTDDEVELLLRVTLDYKTNKLQESVDWETCMSKYIMSAFHEQYPRDSPDREFPHDSTAITKGHLTAKIKNIRGKYRQAVDSGRRSGHGRVVLMFFELCEEIWGGSPATRSIEQGIETADLVETSSSTSELPTDSPQSSDFVESLLPPPVVRQRREMLQAKLNSHRGDRLKRKVPADTGQEELQLKRRMLDLMEESSRRNTDNMQQINNNIANITNTIQEGFSLMRELLVQPLNARPHSSSSVYQGHPPSYNMHQNSHHNASPFIHTPSETHHSGRYTPTPPLQSHETLQQYTPSFSYTRALSEYD
ncbi:unnamed protein product [Knipowitschia caucasica]